MSGGWRVAVAVAVLATAGGPGTTAAQMADEPLEFGGLFQTGFRADPDETGRTNGFEVFAARGLARGGVGLVFDYFVQAEYRTYDETFRLLDAYVTLPVIPELAVTLGLFRPEFGLEALLDRGELTFLERAQADLLIAPGRQVGVSAGGGAFDGRLTYGAGFFNGNGPSLQNDGDDYMFAGRVMYNSIGTIAFYDDFVIQVGGSIGYSSDTSAPLFGDLVSEPSFDPPAAAIRYAGSRLLLGADVQASYRDFTLTGEYYGADYTPDPGGELPDDASAHGGYVEAGYRAYGVLELVTRWDAFKPAVGDDRQFLLFGLNVYPGVYTKIGVQYAVALEDAAPALPVAGDQFIVVAQLAF
ncbi:MAG: porin [Gemmatimonadota bacterium]|nr:porin [Gemmatimonadota bacterium]